HHAAGVDAGEALVHPFRQRAATVGANVAVVAIELGGAGDPAASIAQAAADPFGLVVEQADVGRRRAAEFVGKVDGDGVALDRVDVHPVSQLPGQVAAGRPGTHHHAIKVLGLVPGRAAGGNAG